MHKIYTELWSDEIVLMDDGGNEKLKLLHDAKLDFVDGKRVLITSELPEYDKVEVFIAGNGSTFEAVVHHP